MPPKRAVILLLALNAVSTGCALVPIPYPYDVTGHIRGVRVVDSETGNDVPSAEVAFTTRMGDLHWGVGTGVLCGRQHSVSLHAPDEPFSFAGRIPRQSNGIFHVRKRIRLALLRPWGIGPLGMFMSQEPFPVFTISAHGYRDVRSETDHSGILNAYLSREPVDTIQQAGGQLDHKR